MQICCHLHTQKQKFTLTAYIQPELHRFKAEIPSQIVTQLLKVDSDVLAILEICWQLFANFHQSMGQTVWSRLNRKLEFLSSLLEFSSGVPHQLGFPTWKFEPAPPILS